jgi:hypothetical protein
MTRPKVSLALLRETFGFEGLEQIAKEPNAILEALPFKTGYSPSYRYRARRNGSGGTVTGRMAHSRPNPSADPKRARLPVHIIYEPEDEMQSQPPKSSQPPRDVHALVKAISAGREQDRCRIDRRDRVLRRCQSGMADPVPLR